MAAGDVYKFSSSAVGLGMTVMNDLAIRILPATDPDQATWQAFADEWKEVHRGLQHNSFSYNTWRAVQVFGAGVTYGPNDCTRSGGKLFTGTHTGTLLGGQSATDVLPPQCSGVITLTSPFIGRRKRGRLFIWGFVEADQIAGQWTTTKQAAWATPFTTFFNKYKNGGTSPNFQLGIWSEREATGCIYDKAQGGHVNVNPASPDTAFEPASGFQIRSIVYNQRRRTLGVGR